MFTFGNSRLSQLGKQCLISLAAAAVVISLLASTKMPLAGLLGASARWVA